MVATLAVTLGSWTSPEPAEAQGGPYLIEGTVLGPNGEPVEGVTIHAAGVYGEPSFGPWTSAPTDAAGAFALEVPDGSYIVQLARLPDEIQCRLGYVHSNYELAYQYSDEERIVISGADLTDLTIVLPGTLAELCKPIQGSIADANGKPMGEQGVVALGVGPLQGALDVGRTGADGTFEIYGPPGQYQLRVATAAGNACIVANHPDPRPGQRATIAVDDVGASGLAIVITGDPLDTPQYSNCFFPQGAVATDLVPGWNLGGWIEQTELVPGWKLGGWTEQEAGVEAIFEEISELEAVHAWDASEQRFRSAFASGSQVLGDLDTLTPGMGLWLFVGGTETVEWTRPLLPESGFVLLEDGWNLVAWSGEDSVAVDRALTALRAELRAAAAWEADTGQALHYTSADPTTGNTLQRLARGGALWIEVSEDRPWLQPGVPVPVEFGVDYSEDRQSELRALIDTALTFYAHRFGVFVPGITVRYQDDNERNCFYFGRTIFLKERCWTAIGHEYGHAIQEHLAGGGTSPRWIIEGTANRWSAQFHEARGFRTYTDHLRDTVHPQARRTLTPLEDLEASLSEGGLTQNYNLIHVAIDYLVELVGEDRTFDYFRERANYRTWQDAFHGTFGLSVDDFYTEFAEYRAAAFAPFGAIRGLALTPEGSPVRGLWLGAFPLGEQGYLGASTAPDGTFTLRLPDGAYHLRFHTATATQCTVSGYEGAVAGRQAIIRLDAESISGVQIVASGPPSDEAVWSPCTFAE